MQTSSSKRTRGNFTSHEHALTLRTTLFPLQEFSSRHKPGPLKYLRDLPFVVGVSLPPWDFPPLNDTSPVTVNPTTSLRVRMEGRVERHFCPLSLGIGSSIIYLLAARLFKVAFCLSPDPSGPASLTFSSPSSPHPRGQQLNLPPVKNSKSVFMS